MDKLIYFVLCEGLIEGADGKESLIGLFNAIEIATLPSPPNPKFVLAFSYAPDVSKLNDGKVGFLIEVMSPTNKMIGSAHGSAHIIPDQIDNRLPIYISAALDLSNRIAFPEVGTYTSKLSIMGKHVGSAQFTVVFKTGEVT